MHGRLFGFHRTLSFAQRNFFFQSQNFIRLRFADYKEAVFLKNFLRLSSTLKNIHATNLGRKCFLSLNVLPKIKTKCCFSRKNATLNNIGVFHVFHVNIMAFFMCSMLTESVNISYYVNRKIFYVTKYVNRLC